MHEDGEHGSVGCTIGIAPHVFVGAYGSDAVDALHKASDLAAKVQDLVNKHPELQAALSVVPGGSLAFHALSAASKALKYGHTVEDVARKVGPTVARTVSKILSIF